MEIAGKLKSINDLKDSIDMQMEIEFKLNKKTYLLEPIYDSSGSYAIAWELSTDAGRTTNKINATDPDEVLNVQVDQKKLKDQWKDMDMIFY